MLTINPNVVPKNQQQYKSKITFKGQIDRQITPKVQPKISQTSKKALNILKNIIKVPLLIAGGLIVTLILIYKLLKETDKENKRIKENKMAQQTQDVQKPNFPEFDGRVLENQVRINGSGYPLIAKDAEFANKENFTFPENSTITFEDGTEENLEDFIDKNGFKLKPFGTYEYFTKDENGNVFRKLSKDGKYNYFNLDRNQNDTYYAVSDDNNLYSIDLSKLPVGQEFYFCNRPYTIQTLIPKGAIIKYDNETIKPEDSCDYKKLICFNNRKPYLWSFSSVVFNEKAIDNNSQEKWNIIKEKLKKEEQKLVDEFKEKMKNDRKSRNMVIGSSFFQYEMCGPLTREEPTEEERYFYKKAYDYYTEKYPEYKNCKFEFERRNQVYELVIKNGEETLNTIHGTTKRVEGPILSNSRELVNLGEFKMKYPAI